MTVTNRILPYTIALLLSICCATTLAAREQKDTLCVATDVDSMFVILDSKVPELRLNMVSGNEKITIRRPGAVNNLISSGTAARLPSFDDILSVKFRRHCTSSGFEASISMNISGLYFGFVAGQGMPEPMHTQMAKSLEIGIDNLIGLKFKFSKLSSLTTGFGMGWTNYRNSTGDGHWHCEGRTVSWQPYPEGVSPCGSRIKIYNLKIPVLYKQSMPFTVWGHHPWLGGGVTLNYASHASLKTVWRAPNHEKVSQSSDKIGHRRFSYTLVGMVGVSQGWGIYVRYNPLSVLRGPEQPQFHTLSTGLIIAF